MDLQGHGVLHKGALVLGSRYPSCSSAFYPYLMEFPEFPEERIKLYFSAQTKNILCDTNFYIYNKIWTKRKGMLLKTSTCFILFLKGLFFHKVKPYDNVNTDHAVS